MVVARETGNHPKVSNIKPDGITTLEERLVLNIYTAFNGN
jgi:hypothetical protein